VKIAFTVLGVPVPWQRSGTTRGGRHYTPTKSVEARAAIQKSAMIASYRCPSWNARAKSYGLTLTFYLPDRHVRDWDNLGKQVSDALNKLLYPDDRLIDEVRIRKRYDDPERPRTEAELEVLG
jgi:Holliday junction resolvase RusA-like endonuclease